MMVAMSLIVMCFLALMGYVGYHVVLAENHFVSQMPSRKRAPCNRCIHACSTDNNMVYLS